MAKRIANDLRLLPELPAGFGTSKPFSLPNPVFDKAADKIGMLSGELPEWISEFYNYVMGLRLAYFDALASGPAGVQARVATLDYVAEKWSEMIVLADSKIIPGLTEEGHRWWWPADLTIKAVRAVRIGRQRSP